MIDKYKEMEDLLGVCFGLDADLFGTNSDEKVRSYIYNNGSDVIDEAILDIKDYINEYKKKIEESDETIDDRFGFYYPYEKFYINSIEFLRNVVGKLIVYRLQKDPSEEGKGNGQPIFTREKFGYMIDLVAVYLNPDTNEFGNTLDEIIDYYVENVFPETIKDAVSEIEEYIVGAQGDPAKDDPYFRENFGCYYPFEKQYKNHIDFLKELAERVVSCNKKKRPPRDRTHIYDFV